MTDTIAKGSVGVGMPVLSVIISQVSQIEIGLRILSLTLAVLVSAAMLRSILAAQAERKRLGDIQFQAAERDLCAYCQAGHTPLSCPIPELERPHNCPLERHQKR